jgi:membrane-bound metal-dependent hydrolase YbcI (DUF457 family)
MDPVSHASFGRLLIAAAGARDEAGHRPVRGTVAAAMLGSLSPDLDSILIPFGWDRYLRVHEIGTHTMVGTVACAVLTAAVVRLFVRTRYTALATAAWLGAASHVLLDLLSSARLRPGWPVLDTVVSLPVVAMADPWLLTLCVAGAILSRYARGRSAPRLMLGSIALFVLVKAGLGLAAVAAYEGALARTGEAISGRAVEADWASLTGWRVFDRTPNALRVWHTRVGAQPRLIAVWPQEQEPPVVTASRQLSTVRNFLHAHELVLAGVIPERDGHSLVLWSDIRFCWNPDPPSAPRLEPFLQAGEQRLACGLWFGGEFDAKGQVVREVVKIGGFTQIR